MKYIKKLAIGGGITSSALNMVQQQVTQRAPMTPMVSRGISNNVTPVLQARPTFNIGTDDLKGNYHSFGEAFNAAHKAGLKQFTWGGRPIAVKFAGAAPTTSAVIAPAPVATSVPSQDGMAPQSSIQNPITGMNMETTYRQPAQGVATTVGAPNTRFNSSMRPSDADLLATPQAGIPYPTGSPINPWRQPVAHTPQFGTGVNRINSSIRPEEIMAAHPAQGIPYPMGQPTNPWTPQPRVSKPTVTPKKPVTKINSSIKPTDSSSKSTTKPV